MKFVCQFCSRTFSNRSGLQQHVNFCVPDQSSDEESTDINDMSLGSEKVNEVKIDKVIIIKLKIFNVYFEFRLIMKVYTKGIRVFQVIVNKACQFQMIKAC